MQGKAAVFIILASGIALLMGALVSWSPLMESERLSFLKRKFGARGLQLTLILISLLILSLGVYLFNSGKLEQHPRKEDVIFQF